MLEERFMSKLLISDLDRKTDSRETGVPKYHARSFLIELFEEAAQIQSYRDPNFVPVDRSRMPGAPVMEAKEYLETERETYEREKPRLLAESEGKYAVIHGAEVAGVWDTYADALAAAYEKYGLDAFMVKQIVAMDQIHFFTWDLV
jgi:hypothetical protein